MAKMPKIFILCSLLLICLTQILQTCKAKDNKYLKIYQKNTTQSKPSYQSTINNNKSSECFYHQIGNLAINKSFTFEVLKDQQIIVDGWFPFEQDKMNYCFFSQIGRNGLMTYLNKIEKQAKVIGNQTNLDHLKSKKSQLQVAFGYVDDANASFNGREFVVPEGFNFIALRSQVQTTQQPYIGSWSVFLEMVKDGQTDWVAKKWIKKISTKIDEYQLNSLQLDRSLNIIPQFEVGSLGHVVNKQQLKGNKIKYPITKNAFLIIIKGGTRTIMGKIKDGQQDIIQIKDLHDGAKERCAD